MAAIVFSRLHKKLFSLRLAVYVEARRGSDFRRSSCNGAPG